MNSQNYLSKHIENIDKIFKNTYLNHIHILTNCDFELTFSKSSLGGIIISLNNDKPFIELTKEKYLFTNQNSFFARIKQKILNSKLLSIEVINNDNIVCFSFLKTTDTYDKIIYKLYVELFKNNSNIILTSNEIIIDTIHLKGFETKRPIMPQTKYLLPTNERTVKEINEEKMDQFISNYISNIETKYLDNKYSVLKKSIKSKIKSLNNKIEKVSNDKNEAIKNLEYRNVGDYLLTNYEDNKYLNKYEIDGKTYVNSNFLPLDQYIQKCYKIYKKAKQTIQISEEYINKSNIEKDYLESILSSLKVFKEEDYIETFIELDKLGYIKNKKTVRKKDIPSFKPYYVVFNNVKIGFGKNSTQNDYLTFKEAKKDYYFLHIFKDHGPHVVIFSSTPSNEIKEFASELALYLSSSTVGEVLYTQIKNVKKGDVEGKVNILKYETFNIVKFKYDIASYLLEAKRF